MGRRTDVGRGEHRDTFRERKRKRKKKWRCNSQPEPVPRTSHAETASARHEINRESGTKSRVRAPPTPTLIAGARHGGRGDRNTTLSATVQNVPSSGIPLKTPARKCPHGDLCTHQPPTCSVSETGRGRVCGPGPRARGAYRRRRQAGPPDGLGAGVQRWVLVLSLIHI